MDFIELLVLMASLYFSYKFSTRWYRRLLTIWPPKRNKSAKYILGLLPAFSLAIILYTLMFLAALDVVDNFIFIVFYIALGFAWLYLGMTLLACIFDLSWVDDAVNSSNKAALISITGGFLGLTLIYSGANVGDGPGWWCVVFAGGLGLIVWLALGLAINLFTKIFERITIERNIGCGIRFGFYLLSSGIILARACAGDWTSFSMTVLEFMDGWPVLILAGLAILVELCMLRVGRGNSKNYIFSSLIFGIIFASISVVSILLLPPLKENPIYVFTPIIRSLYV